AGESAFAVTLSASLLPVRKQLMLRLRRLLDLDCRPQQVLEVLGDLARDRPGLRVPGAFDGFETAVRTVLGQQITVKAASTLAARFVADLGEPIETPYADLTHTFPTPQQV